MKVKKNSAKPNDSATVNQYMLNLAHPLKNEIEMVRATLLNANTKIAESVK